MSERRIIIDYEGDRSTLFDALFDFLETREEAGLIAEFDISDTPRKDALLIGEQVDQ